MVRRPEDRRGSALLDARAFRHENNSVSDLFGERHFVSHYHERHASFGQRSNRIQNFADKFRVKGGSRLIEQDDRRVTGDGTGDGDPLLLPPG
jgi:hypothetical protein